MPTRSPCVLAAALACLVFHNAATAAPPFRILNHEQPELRARGGAGGATHVSLDAFGRRFELLLEPNEGMLSAVPAGRADIEPLRGTIEGEPGSWVRLTHTRSGWRGMLSDGRELYAIEPSAEAAGAAVQPLTSRSLDSPVMYRLADALVPFGAGFCGTLPEESAATTRDTTAQDKPTALMAYQALASDLATHDGTTVTRQLTVGVVADHEFTDTFSDDPEGAIIARMDVVDGIFSAQVHIKIALAPPQILRDGADPFTATTVPKDLLAEVSRYRSNAFEQRSSGVTHLMTGRTLEGNFVGIAYLGTVCEASAASLSQGTRSTTLSALIAAHELGHNFNAPHDGQAGGACADTPQTFLMAPKINYSDQFSACSLRQIESRAATAQCLTDLTAQAVLLAQSSSAPSGGSAGASGGGGRVDVALLALLAGALAAALRRKGLGPFATAPRSKGPARCGPGSTSL